MITLTIDNPELERIYAEEFNADAKRFAHYIEELVIANNTEYDEDLSFLEEEIDKALASGISEKSLDEIFDELTKKYAQS